MDSVHSLGPESSSPRAYPSDAFSRSLPVATAAQARQADAAAIHTHHLPSLVLMENAAKACVRVILRLLRQGAVRQGEVWVLCGPGNNGADGLAIARLLFLEGIPVRIYLNEERLSAEETVQLSIVRSLHLRPAPFSQFLADASAPKSAGMKPCALIVDAIFGSGLSRAVEEPYLSVIETLNTLTIPVLAVDLPSGIDADHGRVQGKAVRADWTVALDCLKWGHLLGEGRTACGRLIEAAIGLPASLHDEDGSVIQITPALAAGLLPLRSISANKGSFGRVLLAGGSFSMQGALSMAAKACFHAGCGTLSLFTPKMAAQAIAAKLDLAMIVPAPETEEGFFAAGSRKLLEAHHKEWSCIGCGNGMGQSPGALEVLESVLDHPAPSVLDADALNLLALHPDLFKTCTKPLILTPHLLEFSRLSRLSMDEVLHNPLEAGRKFVEGHPNIVLVLKSDITLIFSKDKTAVLNRPNSALSKGGSGDVLCGLISGLLSSKMDPFHAAVLGVYIHNAAAQDALSPYSFTPLDLIAGFGKVFQSLQSCRDQQLVRAADQKKYRRL